MNSEARKRFDQEEQHAFIFNFAPRFQPLRRILAKDLHGTSPPDRGHRY
jgi:hypothetical protein